jgi:GNAT superfamily N-acetyltransferase
VSNLDKENLSWTKILGQDVDLVLQLMAEYYAFDGLHFDHESAAKLLRIFVAKSELGQGWVIRLHGAPIGYIIMTNGFSLEFGGIYQFIDEFFLVERYRGTGIGAETLRYVERVGREIGAASIHLEVEAHNETAQRFYTKYGYSGHGRSLWSKRLLVNS